MQCICTCIAVYGVYIHTCCDIYSYVFSSWTPPNWVFPAVWIPLKVLQSVAVWLVLKQADTKKELVLPISLFGLHLFLGNWWNGKCHKQQGHPGR